MQHTREDTIRIHGDPEQQLNGILQALSDAEFPLEKFRAT